MKIKFTFLCLISAMAFSYSQESFSGFRSGNYNGVLGVISNPANIAGNLRKWDANLFSVNLGVANNKISLNSENFKKLVNTNLGKSNFFEGNGDISALINADILGPSFMYSINKKHSVAFTSRARIMAGIYDFDINLFLSILEASKDDIKNVKLPYTINSNKNQKITANGWSEFGLSWAGTVYENNNHTIKAGVTLKYLIGFSNSYTNIKEIRGKIAEETAVTNGKSYKRPYLTDAHGELSLVNSGINFIGEGNDFQASDITKSFGNGFGADLGVVYEYRDENTTNWASTGYAKSYTFKAEIALLDLGSIKYTPFKDRAYGYTINVPDTDKLYWDKIADKPEKTLNNSPYVTKVDKSGAYKVSLPSTLRLSADYNIYNNFFIALDTQFSIVGDNPENSFYANNFTLTPRYETRTLGAYFPIGYNQLSGTNVGVALKAGPIFLGSGSILSSLVSGKQIDFFFGIRFGK